jgi:hypothetical protein
MGPPAGKRLASIRLDDKVQMVAQNREFNHAYTQPSACGDEAAENAIEPARAAGAGHVVAHAQRHVRGCDAVEHWPRMMGDSITRRTTRALAAAAMRWKYELDRPSEEDLRIYHLRIEIHP